MSSMRARKALTFRHCSIPARALVRVRVDLQCLDLPEVPLDLGITPGPPAFNSPLELLLGARLVGPAGRAETAGP